MMCRSEAAIPESPARRVFAFPMMLRRFAFLGAATASLAVVALAAPDDPEFLSRLVANIESLHRITAAPHRMADSTATSCRIDYNVNIHEGDVAAAYCHVYVTPAAREYHREYASTDHVTRAYMTAK